MTPRFWPRLRVALAGSILALGGCATGAPPNPDPPTATPRTGDRIPAETSGPSQARSGGTAALGDQAVAEVQAIVDTLASDAFGGRAPGTEGIDKARRFLVDRLRRTGLEPAFDGSFTQSFEVAMGAKVTARSLRLGDHRLDEDRFTVLGFGGDGAFEGRAVFVGYGIAAPKRSYNSFAGLDDDALAGSLAVIYRYEPMTERGRSRWGEHGWSRRAELIRKAREAAERGAAAALIVNPPSHADAKLHRATSTFGGRVGIPTMMAPQSVFERLLREAGVKSPRQAARRWQTLADAGKPHARTLDLKIAGKVELDADLATAHNVAAVAPGAGRLKDRVVVVGAHYDHVGRGAFGSRTGAEAIHPGADDNASGTAAVLLLADRYAQRLAAGDLPDPRRAVLFVGFSAEERGLIGSRHFVNHLDQAGLEDGDIAAMLNFDMVGRLRADRLSVGGVDSGKGWRPLVERAAEAEGLTVDMGGGGLGPSDHANFYRLRTPVLHLFTGLHTDYHTPADTAEKINARGIVRVADVAEAVLDELIARPEPAVAYVSPDEGGAGGRWAHRGGDADAAGAATGDKGRPAFLGVMPDYQSRTPTVASVIEGTPADRAGLRAGDALTHWNAEPLDDLRHLAGKLAEAEPGDKIVLTIKREDQTRKLPVTLGER